MSLTQAEENHLSALQKLVDDVREEGWPDIYLEHLSFWPIYCDLKDRQQAKDEEGRG